MPVGNLRNNKARFIKIVETGINRNRFAIVAVGPQFFTQPALIIIDNRIGGFKYGRGRPVILFQANG